MKKKIPDALMGTFYASFAYHENTQTLVLQSEHTSEVGGACISEIKIVHKFMMQLV